MKYIRTKSRILILDTLNGVPYLYEGKNPLCPPHELEEEVIRESDNINDLIDYYYYELAHCYHQPEFRLAYTVNPVFDVFVEQLKPHLKSGVIVNFKAMIWVGNKVNELTDLHTVATLNSEGKLELV